MSTQSWDAFPDAPKAAAGSGWDAFPDATKETEPARRLRLAREQGTAAAVAGAVDRSEAPTESSFVHFLRTQTPAGLVMDQPPLTSREKRERDLNLAERAAETNADAAKVAGLVGAATVGAPALLNPVAAAKAIALSVAGASAGGYAGRGVGKGLEYAGAPKGTAEVAGTVGGVAGGLVVPIKGAPVLLALAKHAPGRLGALARVAEVMLGREAPAAIVKGAVPAAVSEMEALASRLTRSGTFKSVQDAAMWLKTLNPSQLAAVSEQMGIKAAVPAAEAVAGGTAAGPGLAAQLEASVRQAAAARGLGVGTAGTASSMLPEARAAAIARRLKMLYENTSGNKAAILEEGARIFGAAWPKVQAMVTSRNVRIPILLFGLGGVWGGGRGAPVGDAEHAARVSGR